MAADIVALKACKIDRSLRLSHYRRANPIQRLVKDLYWKKRYLRCALLHIRTERKPLFFCRPDRPAARTGDYAYRLIPVRLSSLNSIFIMLTTVAVDLEIGDA